MDTNPYKSPITTNEPPKVRSRLMTCFDIGAIICAAMPIILFASFVGIARLTSLNRPSNGICTLLLLSSTFLSLIGCVYNLFGVVRGRGLAYIGIVASIASFLLWGGLFGFYYCFVQ
jgi:hypothetical protein